MKLVANSNIETFDLSNISVGSILTVDWVERTVDIERAEKDCCTVHQEASLDDTLSGFASIADARGHAKATGQRVFLYDDWEYATEPVNPSASTIASPNYKLAISLVEQIIAETDLPVCGYTLSRAYDNVTMNEASLILSRHFYYGRLRKKKYSCDCVEHKKGDRTMVFHYFPITAKEEDNEN